MAGAISSASVNLPEPYSGMRQREPGDGAGDADRQRRVARLVPDRPRPWRRGSCRGWSRRARSRDSRSRSGPCRVGEVDHHVAAAADVAGARIGHRQREAGRDRGIDRVAAASTGPRRRCGPRAPPARPPCRGAPLPVQRGHQWTERRRAARAPVRPTGRDRSGTRPAQAELRARRRSSNARRRRKPSHCMVKVMTDPTRRGMPAPSRTA